MTRDMKHAAWQIDETYVGSFFEIGRVHLGTLGPRKQPVFNEDRSICGFMYGNITGPHRGQVSPGGANDLDYCIQSFGEDPEFYINIDGSFVVVLCNMPKEEFTIINDRYGSKPVYISKLGSTLAFASEAKPLLRLSQLNELDLRGVSELLTFGYCLGDRTLFREISLLPPASVLVLRDGRLSIRNYWKWDYQPLHNDTTLELVSALKHAVNARVDEGIRYAIALSGGLDSRSVVGGLPDSTNVTSFTFGEEGCVESRIAELVARRSGMKHRKILLQPDELAKFYTDVISMSDGMDTAPVAFIPYVMGIIRKEADVFFDGIALGTLLGGSKLTAADVEDSSRKLDAASELELASRLYSRMAITHVGMITDLAGKEVAHLVRTWPPRAVLEALKACKSGRTADRVDEFFMVNRIRRHTLMGSIIAQNYLEQAFPTLDFGLISVILRTPCRMRARHRTYRHFLRKLAPDLARVPYEATYVPVTAPRILWTAGRGLHIVLRRLRTSLNRFSNGRIRFVNIIHYVNPDEWLRTSTQWRKLVHSVLLDNNSLSYRKGLLNPASVRRIVLEHEQRKADWTAIIFVLLTLELSLRYFFEDESRRMDYLCSRVSSMDQV